MKAIDIALTVVVLIFYPSRADDQLIADVSKEARQSRKAQIVQRFDLDGNGKLDRAERNMLRAELKAKADPARKRIVIHRNDTTSSTNLAPVNVSQ